VDYKAQSNNTPVETVAYLESQYHQGYKIQMDVYAHILRKMKFKVSDIAYFLVCNAIKTPDRFDEKLQFDLTLVPYKTDTSWVEDKITQMKATLESPNVPEINKYCEKCMYLDTGKNFI
jgi:predicted RecB family nuclease